MINQIEEAWARHAGKNVNSLTENERDIAEDNVTKHTSADTADRTHKHHDEGVSVTRLNAYRCARNREGTDTDGVDIVRYTVKQLFFLYKLLFEYSLIFT